MLKWNKKIFYLLIIILLTVFIIYLMKILIFHEVIIDNSVVTTNLTMHKTTLKIMPLGDSITEGDLYGGYRVNLKQMMDNVGFNTDFVGRKTTNGNTTGFIDIEHEGYNSATIDTLGYPYLISDEIDEDIIETFKPRIVLLLIGTNDLFCQCKSEIQIIDSLSILINKILNKDEKLYIIVGTVPPLGSSRELLNNRVNKLNLLLPTMISSKGNRVSLVDINLALNRFVDLSDDIHPNRDGYKKIAEVWFSRINEMINLTIT